MEFPFPPPPPEYSYIIAARWACAIWTLLAAGWLLSKFRWKQTIHGADVIWWYGIAVGGVVLAGMGMSQRPAFQGFSMVWWALAVIVISLAGGTLGLIQLGRQRDGLSIACTVIVYCLTLFFVLCPNLVTPLEAIHFSQCKSNLKQIGLAMHNYAEVRNTLPPSVEGQPPLSWRVALLLYLDQQKLFSKYNPKQPWDQIPNSGIALRETSAAHYRCPSNYSPQDIQGRWLTAYSLPTGKGTVGATPRGVAFREISDGLSNTLLVVEACGADIVWTEPRDVNFDTQPAGMNLPGARAGLSADWLSSYHGRGTYVLLADGSARFLSKTTDPALLRKLATTAGGEHVGDF